MIGVLLLCASTILANDVNSESQIWTSRQGPPVEVRLQPSKRKVSVQLDWPPEGSSRPRALRIVLTDSEGKTREFELRPLPLPARPGVYGVNWTSTSPGMLPEVAVAFELRIPLERGKTRILRSNEFNRRTE